MVLLLAAPPAHNVRHPRPARRFRWIARAGGYLCIRKLDRTTRISSGAAPKSGHICGEEGPRVKCYAIAAEARPRHWNLAIISVVLARRRGQVRSRCETGRLRDRSSHDS